MQTTMVLLCTVKRKVKSRQQDNRMCVVLLPVDICQCDALQRHLHVDYDRCEGTGGLLQCRAHRFLHCTGARQHLSEDSIQVDKVTSYGRGKHFGVRGEGGLMMHVVHLS